MEEYIRLEEEKARRHGRVYNWETATYGKIRVDDDFHDLRSMKTEFPAIVFNDTFTSEATLLCKPTEITDNPNITMEEYIRLEEEKARRHGRVYNWETATYGKIRVDDDFHDLRSMKTEFPAIVFNDTFTSEATLLCKPT
nr:hypothetical protein [Tanacetum cinerariifolium]